jgi:putative resolvase
MYPKYSLNQRGCEIVVINKNGTEDDDLMQDFVSIITSMTARLYGKRRNQRRTEELIKQLKETP